MSLSGRRLHYQTCLFCSPDVYLDGFDLVDCSEKICTAGREEKGFAHLVAAASEGVGLEEAATARCAAALRRVQQRPVQRQRRVLVEAEERGENNAGASPRRRVGEVV